MSGLLDCDDDTLRDRMERSPDLVLAEVRRLQRQAALLLRAERALWGVSKALLTVSPTLKKPYPDAPDANPWDQFVRKPANAAYDLRVEIQRALADDET